MAAVKGGTHTDLSKQHLHRILLSNVCRTTS
jgi:hypothetical protein